MQVKEVMQKNVVVTTREAPILEVAKILNIERLHALPVLENKKLVGIIAESDFFTKDEASLYLPAYLEFLSRGLNIEQLSGHQRALIENLLSAKVEDIMSSPCASIREDAELQELFGLIKGRNLHTVPVVDANENLVGIITLTDLVKFLKIGQ